MQAVSGSRKDCDSLFLLNEVPCVNVVYMGKYFVHGIFPEYFSLFTQYALKWTQKYLYIKVFLHFFLIIETLGNCLIVFFIFSVCLCHYLDVTLFLSAFIIRRNSSFVLGKGVCLQL